MLPLQTQEKKQKHHIEKFGTAWPLLIFAKFSNLWLNFIHVHIHGLAALDHLSVDDRLHHCDDLCDHWGSRKLDNDEPKTQSFLKLIQCWNRYCIFPKKSIFTLFCAGKRGEKHKIKR